MNEGNDYGFRLTNPDAVSAQVNGMTLRDYFAGQVLAGWMASYSPDARPDLVDEEASCSLAVMAYRVADAMIAERAK